MLGCYDLAVFTTTLRTSHGTILVFLFSIPPHYSVDFFHVSLVIIRCFQYEGQPLQRRVQRDPLHRFHSDASLSQFLMTILVGSTAILAVIEMDCLKPGEPDYLIKML